MVIQQYNVFAIILFVKCAHESTHSFFFTKSFFNKQVVYLLLFGFSITVQSC